MTCSVETTVGEDSLVNGGSLIIIDGSAAFDSADEESSRNRLKALTIVELCARDALLSTSLVASSSQSAVCIYIYIYIHIYTYTHTHTHKCVKDIYNIYINTLIL